MDIAALIISVIALLMGGSSLVWQLAKHFSTHQIQMVPMDVDKYVGSVENPKADPMGDIYKEFSEPRYEPLSPGEEALLKP